MSTTRVALQATYLKHSSITKAAWQATYLSHYLAMASKAINSLKAVAQHLGFAVVKTNSEEEATASVSRQ